MSDSEHPNDPGAPLQGHEVHDVPHVDFSTFVLSLGHSALIQLGAAPDPETQKMSPHLPMARQTIDLLGVLEEKTKGNLTGEEERLLSHLLYDLRMRCLELEKAAAGTGSEPSAGASGTAKKSG